MLHRRNYRICNVLCGAVFSVYLTIYLYLSAMNNSQYQVLKTAILSDPTLADAVAAADDEAIADAMNSTASPDYWVWRTRLTRHDMESSTSVDNTVWSFTAFIARSQGERDCWREMLADGWVNPSLVNVRQGVADIFSGAANSAPQQRAHLLAVSRRKASRLEKLFATGGDGTTNNISTMTVEGPLSYAEVSIALRD